MHGAQVHTIEAHSQEVRVVGHAVLELFLDAADNRQPLNRNVREYILNQGAFQVRRGLLCCRYLGTMHLFHTGSNQGAPSNQVRGGVPQCAVTVLLTAPAARSLVASITCSRCCPLLQQTELCMMPAVSCGHLEHVPHTRDRCCENMM